MKKQLVFEYEWINEEYPHKEIPPHHENRLMGFAEFYLPVKSRGKNRSGNLACTCKDKDSETRYKGTWLMYYVHS